MPFPHQKLRERREALGLTRKELAAKVGMNPRLLDGLEQGSRDNPTMDTIRLLCKALDVTCDFFFVDDAPIPPEPPKGKRK